MNTFRRRPLRRNGEGPPDGHQTGQSPQAGQSHQAANAKPEGEQSHQTRTGNQAGHGHPQGEGRGPRRRRRGPHQGGQQQGQGRSQQQGRVQQRPQSQQQGRPQQAQHSRPQAHGRPQPPRRPPPPPPAYYQRSLLLVLAAESAPAIDQVRTKFDPLTKKVPAHVTLVFPEPAACIPPDYMKRVVFEGLPPVEEITFTNVVVHEDKYLFLLPDEDGRTRLIQWREKLLANLPQENTQWSEFIPHLTLGYVPRSMTADEAVGFARTHITLPVTLKFKQLMLEEFGDDQLSKELDALALKPD